jgi:hypothetical protein
MMDLGGLLGSLADAGVEMIVVGGAAATAHGAARLTQDIDIVYERSTSTFRHFATAATSRSRPTSARSTCLQRSRAAVAIATGSHRRSN